MSIILLSTFKLYSQVDWCDVTEHDSLVLYDNKPFTGFINYYHKGQLMSRNYFVMGLLDSTSSYWDKHGNKISEINYKFGKKDGLSKYFYKNGILWQSIEYKNDKECGFWKDYYKNGKIKREQNLDDGDLVDGIFYKWNRKGEKYKYTEIDISRNKKIGKLTFYSDRSKYIKSKLNTSP